MFKTGDMSKRAIVQTEYDTVLRLILQHTILFDKLKRCMHVNKKLHNIYIYRDSIYTYVEYMNMYIHIYRIV